MQVGAGAGISVDRNGERVLTLRGEWTPETERAIGSDGWDVLGLFGVEWNDYTPLVAHAARIRNLRVPLGPDSSVGLDRLTELRVAQLTDVLVPAVDFRRLPALESLEAVWDRAKPEYFANPTLRDLVLHHVGGKNLDWLPRNPRLRKLELKGGRLVSLAGVEHAEELETLRATGLKQCVDVSSVMSLENLRVIDLQTPKASLPDLAWLGRMAAVENVSIEAHVQDIDWDALAAVTTLRTLAVVSDAAPPKSEPDFRKQVADAGRCVSRFEHYRGKQPGFYLEVQ